MEVYLGLIFPAAFTYTTQGLVLCNGALLPLMQYQALYAVIGSVYGGDARTTFGVPNLVGRFPIGFGAIPGSNPPTTNTAGQFGGQAQVSLTQANLPQAMAFTGTATTTINAVANPAGNAVANPVGNVIATGSTGGATPAPVKSYVNPSGETLAAMSSQAATTTVTIKGTGGSGVGIPTMPPYQAINYFIVTLGLFPSRN